MKRELLKLLRKTIIESIWNMKDSEERLQTLIAYTASKKNKKLVKGLGYGNGYKL